MKAPGLFSFNCLLLACVVLSPQTGRADSDAEQDVDANAFRTSPEFFETFPDGTRPSMVYDERARIQLAGPIAPASGQPAGALSGRIVFMSAGHGWTWHNANNVWYTQRAQTNEMIEDYGNLDQMTMFAFYCFNAGATVVPFRPIGFQTNEVVLDNDDPDVTFAGNWSDSSSTIFYGSPGDVPYRFASITATETAAATYTPVVPAEGFYPVYAWVRHGPDRTSQLYRINHTGGQSLVRVPHHMVGNGWVYLGTYYFHAGANGPSGSVVISNVQPAPAFGGVVIADAIRFGNGMGGIVPAAGAAVSGYSREEEASRYWVQAGLGQGQPSSIFDTGSDDGSDNVGTPPRMAREMNREAAGSFFQRIFLSFHSNAGGGRGTLGLYNDNSLFPGTATSNQFRWAQLAGAEVNDDLSALAIPPLEVAWFNRGANITYARTDFAFGEIRNDAIGGEMDATIIEVAFHDHADDARLMRDPKVRNAVARACCQAAVRYMNQFDAVPLNFLPEPPVRVRAVAGANGTIVISWSAPGAGGGNPTGYVIYRSLDGYGFGNPLSVSGGGATSVALTNVSADTAIFFRVAAVNAGGESLPSETVACRRASNPGGARVLFVNGFDRFDRTLNARQTAGPGIGGPNGGTGTFDRVKPRQANAFDYVVRHGQSISRCGVAFDSCPNDAVISGSISLAGYPAVVWALGEESTADESFSAAEQTLVANYLNGGGNLFVSGSEIAWDLDRDTGPLAPDRAFLNSRLHADLGGNLNDDAGTYQFAARAGSIFAGNAGGRFDDGTVATYDVDFPDALTTVGAGASAAIDYVGGSGGAAALQYDGSGGGGRVVYFGFPFEAITVGAVRDQYMSDVLRFFGLLAPPQLSGPQIDSINGNVTIPWTAIPGSTYQLQYKNQLSDPSWTNLGGPMTASGENVSAVDAGNSGAVRRFYRVAWID
ncbi:MAG TPA: fibronectin type III domain-containing protein [Verrucomicrobiae bacterium]|nr:fibronectin type III domain-containing protein [Verrucomicrobiae bacterium]